MASSMKKKIGPGGQRKPTIYKSNKSMKKELATLYAIQTIDNISRPSSKTLSNDTILPNCLKLVSMMISEERKVPKLMPRRDNSEIPDVLGQVQASHAYVETKESQLLVEAMRGFFTDKHYRFRISTVLDMSSGGTGLINSTISNSVLTSNTAFVALSQVFNEFFVEKFTVSWQPVSRYNYPLTGVTATSVSSAPLGKASLQHGQTAYTSLGAMASNYAFGYHNSGDPFHEEWVNVEKSSTPTVVTTTGTTQAWTSVGNVANYLGSLQFRSQIPPPLPATQVIGTFATHFYVLFRVRV